ncbi:MAG: Gfo/Idh/MocA family oxidoreductase [Bryobacteraceae bacterium]|nr:Gfo/Idh/MocA family oxidoreductase [Bryobacteraceae bacterium]MDW8376994.1 Gfo/Idh/MocA family oxidoreductase [Bryobacterales bacterium]
MNRRTVVETLALAPALSGQQKKISVAVITQANGPHLSSYAEGLAQSAEVESVAVCDPQGATQEELKKILGAKFLASFRSSRELFTAFKPQLAFVVLEAALAPRAISEAFDAGCHVMAEKPACVRPEDFASLVKRAKSQDRLLMLALANRVDPVMREARRLLQSGAIGRIYGMEMHTIADQTRLKNPAYHHSWLAKRARSGGGHLLWLGIHWLDLAIFLTGSKITQVTGFTANVGGQPIEVEDSAALALRFASGTFGTLTSGYYLDRGKHLFFKFWGSHGWLEIRHHRAENPLEWYSTKQDKPQTHHFQPLSSGGYVPWVKHVVRAAAGLEAPALTAEESLHVLEVIFAAYRAAESGRAQVVL